MAARDPTRLRTLLAIFRYPLGGHTDETLRAAMMREVHRPLGFETNALDDPDYHDLRALVAFACGESPPRATRNPARWDDGYVQWRARRAHDTNRRGDDS